MKKLISILFVISSFAFSQDYDFQQLCIDCSNANGYYCGDDPANWTQYAPMGCVQTSWLNDGWEDCIDASDENGAVPTTEEECAPPELECDTVYVEVPVVEYIYETDTIVEIEYIEIFDTIIEIQYEEIVEYIDCESGLPCNSSLGEVIEKSKGTNILYNLQGQAIRKPEGIYIEGGKVKYKIN
jgi:hypothetical protein